MTTSGRAEFTATKHGGYMTKNKGLFLRQTEPWPYWSIGRQISVHDTCYQIVGFFDNKTILNYCFKNELAEYIRPWLWEAIGTELDPSTFISALVDQWGSTGPLENWKLTQQSWNSQVLPVKLISHLLVMCTKEELAITNSLNHRKCNECMWGYILSMDNWRFCYLVLPCINVPMSRRPMDC